MYTNDEAGWWVPDDTDWDAPGDPDEHPWGCECPTCQVLYAEMARQLATPDELAEGDEVWDADDVIELAPERPPAAALPIRKGA